MMLNSRGKLSDYLTNLLSKGEVVFTDRQALETLGTSKRSFLDAAEKQQRRGYLLSPRRGFYVIVPPQFLSWGAPPPGWYIDALMKHEEAPYYVGLLKAAELLGASHQAVMEFQVVTNKRLPRIKAGRSSLAFYYRKDMDGVRGGVQDHKTDTGRIRISGPELTALDLVRYPHAAAGLDHIVTVLADLGERIDADTLAALARAYERSVLQRLGFLLGHSGHGMKAEELYQRLSRHAPVPWVELEPGIAKDPDFTPDIIERNERWHVICRRVPEADD